MKLKADFISNCSSSSFIVGNASADMVSLQMLERILSEWESEDFDVSIVRTKVGMAVDFLKKEGEKHPRYFFPWGVNYDNWVKEIGPFRTRVDTCNNISWDNSLYIHEYLSEDEIHSAPQDDDETFMDLTDFRIKTRQQIEKERYLDLGFPKPEEMPDEDQI